MRKKLEKQAIEPVYSIVYYREDGKKRNLDDTVNFFLQKLLGRYCNRIFLYQNKENKRNSKFYLAVRSEFFQMITLKSIHKWMLFFSYKISS